MTQVAEAQALGLTAAELGRIIDLLGREPNRVELAVFSLLWSEHCAYKHSKKLLRKLPTEGPRVLMGPGENAGAVDAGDGLAVVFKVESHNHPSAVEPFQGAATGRRRDPARHLRARRSADRGARLAAVRRRLDAPDPVSAGAGGGRHRGVRQLGRRADRRRRDLLRAALRAELPRERDVRRACTRGRADSIRSGGAGKRSGADRRPHRPGRDRRCERAGLRGAR